MEDLIAQCPDITTMHQMMTAAWIVAGWETGKWIGRMIKAKYGG